MDRQKVMTQLTDPALGQQIAEALRTWPNADAGDIAKTVDWVMAVRSNFVSLLREVDDDGELVTTLAINYIELKSHWIALNTKINYQNFRRGACDSRVAFQATGISMLLGQLESMIEQSDLDKITEFLAAPVRQAA